MRRQKLKCEARTNRSLSSFEQYRPLPLFRPTPLIKIQITLEIQKDLKHVFKLNSDNVFFSLSVSFKSFAEMAQEKKKHGFGALASCYKEAFF